MDFFGEGNDPTAGVSAGLGGGPGPQGGVAPAQTPAPTPGVNGGQQQGVQQGQQAPSIADFQAALGRPLTKEELKQLAGGNVFLQEDVNMYVSERLRRERAQSQAIYSQLQQAYAQRLQELQQVPQDDQQGQMQAQLAFQQIEERLADFELDTMLSRLAARWPDFGPNEDEILRVGVENGVGPEAAYKLWKSDAIIGLDIADIEKRAVDRYVKEKITAAGAVPRPEGPGGAAAPTPQKKRDLSWDSTEIRKETDAIRRRVAQSGG